MLALAFFLQLNFALNNTQLLFIEKKYLHKLVA